MSTDAIRLLVFGGRNYQYPAFVDEGIIRITDGVPWHKVTIIHGKARTGTDAYAHDFCERWAGWGLIELSMPAAWDDVTAPGAVVRNRAGRTPYNVAAGFVRNQRMLDVGKPTHALGTAGGAGTADMRGRIEHANHNGAGIVLTMLD